MDKKNKKTGRPREYDRERIAIDMIKWAQRFDSININKFCACYEPPFSVKKLSLWAGEDHEFRESYDIAKSFLAFRREEWLAQEKLHVKAYDLSASAYDFIIKEEKREQSKFESSLKEKEQSSISENDNKRFDAMMAQIQALQSDRNIASNTIRDAQ